MNLPPSTEWALHCCWLLAQSDGTPLARRRLAEFFDLPEPYLAKVLKSLVNAKVLESVPGNAGGYRLSRAASKIRVLDVVEALSGTERTFRCAEIRQRGPVGLSREQCRVPCRIAVVMADAENAYRDSLAKTTLADLVANTSKPSVDRVVRWLGQHARAGLQPAPPTRTRRQSRSNDGR
ncbi:RrF2 family transcriptional regulator [Mycobacterium paraterrae]|uniref:Rrf2 family transcriptional regulator n=1 Tax=Mycobacterium paraterrae TaxID=577492 RepID=A0ABY3VPY8_9MYCO|nr:Rrf2 family transcriptional regulator [Mycobacterium paraterrae]UMB69548.1 Rrf2 family transcriptional regulator [Mycobacterium paraterrae]